MPQTAAFRQNFEPRIVHGGQTRVTRLGRLSLVHKLRADVVRSVHGTTATPPAVHTDVMEDRTP